MIAFKTYFGSLTVNKDLSSVDLSLVLDCIQNLIADCGSGACFPCWSVSIFSFEESHSKLVEPHKASTSISSVARRGAGMSKKCRMGKNTTFLALFGTVLCTGLD